MRRIGDGEKAIERDLCLLGDAAHTVGSALEPAKQNLVLPQQDRAEVPHSSAITPSIRRSSTARSASSMSGQKHSAT